MLPADIFILPLRILINRRKILIFFNETRSNRHFLFDLYYNLPDLSRVYRGKPRYSLVGPGIP